MNQGPRPDPRGGIRVSGAGIASGKPDIVRIALVAISTRPTLSAALASSEETARRVRDSLARFGVKGDDAATSHLTVQAEQVWENERGPRVTGFRAEHGISVTLRDLKVVGPAIGEALFAGGDDARLNDVAFAVEDPSSLRFEARQAAWDDAVSRAQHLASLAGRELGTVLHISEGDGGGSGAEPPTPKMALLAASAPSVAPEPGRVEVAVNLRVHWSLA